MKSSEINPIIVLSGSEVAIQAKKDTINYIYDNREAIDETNTDLYSGAIHSLVDLEIGGKGKLEVESKNNNGIHSKDDLQVKNLTLSVSCIDNALKGNDSVEITDATITLISKQGDGIKTINSDVSSKGNQRGTISINGGTINIYAACDGIDAAYNVVIDNEATKLNIYTDKYSNYSEEVTDTKEGTYYVRFSSSTYKYSIKYYNSDSDYEWVDATYSTSTQGGMGKKYYYYTFPKKTEYSKLKVFVYTSSQTAQQETNYYACTDYLSLNDSYDTIAFSTRNGSISYSWTNYTTSSNPGGVPGGGPGGGPGGMQDGNTDKGDHSTKAIKAANEIQINNGTLNLKSYDDAIHANKDTTLENGDNPTGNVTINGGILTIYSNDDGIHADGVLKIIDGIINITNSYEGIEGNTVEVSGGVLSINAKDDGINAIATSGSTIVISGGLNYIYCTGDGIDSNSTTSYSGILFSGGKTVIISNSNGNSSIDSERGYKYTGGYVVAIMPNGGMTSESTNCSNFSSIGKKQSTSLSANGYLNVSFGTSASVVIKMPVSISGLVVALGSSSASISTSTSNSNTLDSNGVYWK